MIRKVHKRFFMCPIFTIGRRHHQWGSSVILSLAPKERQRRRPLKMWQMQIGWEKLNVTNVYRQKKSIVPWTNELLKWLHAPGIHYPQQLPAEAPVCGANTVGGHQPSPILELCLYDGVLWSTLWNARVWKSVEVFNSFLWGWHELHLKQNKQQGDGHKVQKLTSFYFFLWIFLCGIIYQNNVE